MTKVVPGSGADDTRVRKATNADTWTGRFTHQVGLTIRTWRKRRRLTLDHLSRRTTALGCHVPLTVLTNLELGRRESVGAAELVVIAAALNVSPIQLLAPIGEVDEQEILPGMQVSPWTVRDWFIGRDHPTYEGFDDAQWRNAATPIVAWETHATIVGDYQATAARLTQTFDTGGLAETDEQRRVIATSQASYRRNLIAHLTDVVAMLREHRDHMRVLGYTLPPLPIELLEVLGVDS